MFGSWSRRAGDEARNRLVRHFGKSSREQEILQIVGSVVGDNHSVDSSWSVVKVS